MQSRLGDDYDQGGEKGKSLRGSGNQNQREHGQGKWAHQPLPFDIHVTIHTVRKQLLFGTLVVGN
jgi:hypothetical protein